MPHLYNVTVEAIDEGTEDAQQEHSVQFAVSNHDDIFKIVEKMKEKSFVPDEDVEAFTIGLKLFTEVLMKHRRDPIFSELWPHMGDFMKAMKAYGTEK